MVVYGLFSYNKTKCNQLSVLIRWLTGKPYSHFAWLIEVDIYESCFPKSRKIPYADWLKMNHVVDVVEVKLSKEHYDLFRKECEANLGVRYSIFQLGVVLLQLGLKAFIGWFSRIVWNGKLEMVCSEYGYRTLSSVYRFKLDEAPDGLDVEEWKAILEEAYEKPVPNKAGIYVQS